MPEGILTSVETPAVDTEYFFGDVKGLAGYRLKIDISNIVEGDSFVIGPRYQMNAGGNKLYFGRTIISYESDIQATYPDGVFYWAPEVLPDTYEADFGIIWLATGVGGIKDIPWSFVNVVTGE